MAWVMKIPDTVVVLRKCKSCGGAGFKTSGLRVVDIAGIGSVMLGNSVFCGRCGGKGSITRYLCRGRSLTPVVHRTPTWIERLFA